MESIRLRELSLLVDEDNGDLHIMDMYERIAVIPENVWKPFLGEYRV